MATADVKNRHNPIQNTYNPFAAPSSQTIADVPARDYAVGLGRKAQDAAGTDKNKKARHLSMTGF